MEIIKKNINKNLKSVTQCPVYIILYRQDTRGHIYFIISFLYNKIKLIISF